VRHLRNAEANPIKCRPANLTLRTRGTFMGCIMARAVLDIGQRPAPVKPDFVVDLLTALSRIDAQPRGERCRASAGLAQNIQAGRCPGPGRSGLRQAGREHGMAGGRAAAHGISRPLAQAHRPAAGGPTDWAGPNPVKCTCADCRELGAFLIAVVHQTNIWSDLNGLLMHVQYDGFAAGDLNRFSGSERPGRAATRRRPCRTRDRPDLHPRS
jgi:hypothetical protein